MPKPSDFDLSENEAALVDACGKTGTLICTGGHAELRAEVVRALCLGERPEWPVPRAVQIQGFHIVGDLDLALAHSIAPLVLHSCSLTAGINLRFANARVLEFIACDLGSFAAARAVLTDNLVLKDTRITGQLELRQATVDGQIHADGLIVSPTNNVPAIRADGIKVGGDIFLRGCRLRGQARFSGAHVGGNFELDGATLESPNGSALTLERSSIEGSVFLRALSQPTGMTDFHSLGEITLLGAKIEDELNCEGALMENPGGRALVCDRAHVGSIFLTNGFRARGAVHLSGTRIGSNLEIHDAVLENPDGHALFAVEADIRGVLIMWNLRAKPTGRVNLEHTSARALLDDVGSWPSQGYLEINGLKYEELGFRGPLDASRRLEWLRLQPKRPFRPQPYEQLAQVLRSMGRASDATVILAARQDDLRRYGDLPRRDRIVNSVLGITVGHGYFPGRIWWWVIGSVTMAWAIYAVFHWSGTLVPKTGLRTPWLQLLLLAVGKLLPIVNIERELGWSVDPLSFAGGLLRLFELLYRVLGWALAALAAAALTGLIRKE